MFCIHCGKKLRGDSLFCERCEKAVKSLKQIASELPNIEESKNPEAIGEEKEKLVRVSLYELKTLKLRIDPVMTNISCLVY